MPEQFMLEELLGLDLNTIEGIKRNPTTLFNLNNDRAGGYVALGEPTVLGSAEFGQLLGFDNQGLSSFNDNSTSNVYFNLFDGTTMHTSTTSIPSKDAVHIPGAGGYSRRTAFFMRGYDYDFNLKNWEAPAASQYTPTLEVIDGNLGDTDVTAYYIQTVTFFKSLAGAVVVGYTSPEQFILESGQGIKITAPTMDSGLFMAVYYYAPTRPPLEIFPAVGIKTLKSEEEYEFIETTAGFTIGDLGKFSVMAFDPSVPPIVHGSVCWGVPNSNYGRFARRGLAHPNHLWDDGNYLIASLPGWLNIMGNFFLPVLPEQSTDITALASSSGGPLVFFENETHLIQGNRYANYRPVPYPQPVGCDAGIKPVSLGRSVFVIWRGEVWELAYGQAREISRPVFLRTQNFVRLGVDIRQTDVLVQDDTGAIYRYNIERDFWYQNPFSQANGIMLPHPDSDSTRYIVLPAPNGAQITPAEPADEVEEEIIQPPEPPEADLDIDVIIPVTVNPPPTSTPTTGGDDIPEEPDAIERPDDPIYKDYGDVLFDLDADFIRLNVGDSVQQIDDVSGLFQDISYNLHASQTRSAHRGTLAEGELPVTPYAPVTITDAPYDPEDEDAYTLFDTAPTNHLLESGDRVTIAGETSNTNINGDWFVIKFSDTTFKAYTKEDGLPVFCTSNAEMTDTPTVTKVGIKHLEFNDITKQVWYEMLGDLPGILEGSGGFTLAAVVKCGDLPAITGGNSDWIEQIQNIWMIADIENNQIPLGLLFGRDIYNDTTEVRFEVQMNASYDNKEAWNTDYDGTGPGDFRELNAQSSSTVSPTTKAWRVVVVSFTCSPTQGDAYLESAHGTNSLVFPESDGNFEMSTAVTQSPVAAYTPKAYIMGAPVGSTSSGLPDISGLNFTQWHKNRAYSEYLSGGTLVALPDRVFLEGGFARIIGYRKALSNAEVNSLYADLAAIYL